MPIDFTKPLALLVGVDRYKGYRELFGARADAEDLKAWLLAIGVPADNITSLLSPLKEDKTFPPVSLEVHAWLDMLDEEAQAEARKDQAFPLGPRVYVMFAGHGYNAATGQQTAIFPRSNKNFWDVMPIVPVKTYLETAAYFQEVIVLSDACRDQIDFAPDLAFPRKPETSPNASKVKVFQVYAAKAGQKAKEKKFNGKFRGVMTHAFLRGVTGAARDDDGHVTTTKLKNFIKSAVISELGESLKPEVIEGDEFVICDAPKVFSRLRINPVQEKAGTATLKFHTGNQEAPIDLSLGAQVIEVPIGKYTLTTPNKSTLDITAIWDEQDVNV